MLRYVVLFLLFEANNCRQFGKADQRGGQQPREAFGKVLNPLRKQLQRLDGLLLPISAALPVLLPLQHLRDQDGDVVRQVEVGVELRGDEQPQKGQSRCLGDVFSEEVLDVDEHLILNEDGDAVWVLAGCQLQVLVDFGQLLDLYFVLQSSQALLCLGQLLHHLHRLLQEVVRLYA